MNDRPEKEAVYKLDMIINDPDFLKPLFGKYSRRHYMIIQFVILAIVLEHITLMLIDRSSSWFFWTILPLLIVVRCILVLVVAPGKRKAFLEKLRNAGEDCITYTFYDDSVKVNTSSSEVLLKYETAELFAEDDKRLIIKFPFGRSIQIFKDQCDEDSLDFIRGIVPENNQKKSEKKTIPSFLIRFTLLIILAAAFAYFIGYYASWEKNHYVSDYPNTTYVSFEACLKAGIISDVVIINDKYVEYTYTGKGKKDRYYTVYDGDDIDELIAELNKYNTNWKFE